MRDAKYAVLGVNIHKNHISKKKVNHNYTKLCVNLQELRL